MKKALALMMLSMTTTAAYAETAAAAGSSGEKAYFALGAAIAIATAALGGALGQARIGASAMEGIARNPQAQQNMFVSMIIGLVLIESLVIYSLVVAILLINKI